DSPGQRFEDCWNGEYKHDAQASVCWGEWQNSLACTSCWKTHSLARRASIAGLCPLKVLHCVTRGLCLLQQRFEKIMWRKRRRLKPLGDRGPLRVLFVITSMPIGGAETLLVSLVRRLDRERFRPELCCLKELGVLGTLLADEMPAFDRLLSGKHDVRVFARLVSLLRKRQTDAVITVGAGDKMFWGRLAGWWGRVPVVLSALHSTGWPDAIGRLNRALTPLTDAFIAVAESHGRYLIDAEGLPREKVRAIPNGIDVDRFRHLDAGRARVRSELGIPPSAPVCGIVAALRFEKNHPLFVEAAELVHRQLPQAHFLVVGEGPERRDLEERIRQKGLGDRIHLLGARQDIPELLSAMDLFSLTSRSEANPVSILEAMACGVPVVATRVGSVPETVFPGCTGFLAEPNDAKEMAEYWLELMHDPVGAQEMGEQGRRRVVEHGSIGRMVQGYEDLIEEIYRQKCGEFPFERVSPLPLAGTTR
ncbi:MAG: glycosyltransferase, partial [Pirellulaceae bacterium]